MFQVPQINKCKHKSSVILFLIKTDISRARVFRISASAYCLTALNGFNGLLVDYKSEKRSARSSERTGERIRLPRK